VDSLRFAFPEHDSPPLRSSAPVCFCWLLESSCKEWRERDWEWRRSDRKAAEERGEEREGGVKRWREKEWVLRGSADW
jgi:hypothetical protein